MRHRKSGRKLKRTSSHKKALMRNLATALFEHKKIETTEAKAKELRPYAERLITKAKKALAREQQGLLPEGQKIDIHNRRIVAKHIKTKAVLEELFDAIAPVVENRAGGYTRIVKTGFRRGDAGRTAIIELVDWSAPVDGATGSKKKKSTPKKAAKPKVEEVVEPKEEVVEEVVEETPVNEVATEEAPAEVVEETPAEEAKDEAPAEDKAEGEEEEKKAE